MILELFYLTGDQVSETLEGTGPHWDNKWI